MNRTLSSSAYSLEVPYRNQQRLVEEQLEKKRKYKQKQKAMRRRKFYFTVHIVLILGACMLFLYGNAQITQISRENSNLQQEYENLVAKNQKLSVDIQAMRDTKVIEDLAINQLGMVKPAANQTVYLDLGKTDQVNLASDTQAEETKTGLAAIVSDGINSILSYFS